MNHNTQEDVYEPTTVEMVEKKQRAVEEYLRWLSEMEVKLSK